MSETRERQIEAVEQAVEAAAIASEVRMQDGTTFKRAPLADLMNVRRELRAEAEAESGGMFVRAGFGDAH